MFEDRKRIKGIIAAVLTSVLLVTVLAPVASAQTVTETIPDLSEYGYTVIDEISPETTVNELLVTETQGGNTRGRFPCVPILSLGSFL